LIEGIVIKSTGSWYLVKTDNQQILQCKIRGALRTRDTKSTNPVVVGDRVFVITKAGEKTGVINEVVDRRNYIIRKSSNLSRQTHIIAANIDQALLIVTVAYPKTSLRFIDRFLATAEAYQIPAVIVFNKTDLYNMEELAKLEENKHIYERIGYTCLKTSAMNGDGMKDFDKLLRGKVTLLSGHSGVGKSTLVNFTDPGLKLKTGVISDYHLKGKHTTTFSEMHQLSNGGYIIDTPGIKGFGMVDMDREEIFHFFPEIFKASHKCKYYNCLHINEPDCAVISAVESGDIHLSRYESYISIYFEDSDEKYR
jgi:ribosome biogenesis GTPase / thiamine phosphate phosphatase